MTDVQTLGHCERCREQKLIDEHGWCKSCHDKLMGKWAFQPDTDIVPWNPDPGGKSPAGRRTITDTALRRDRIIFKMCQAVDMQFNCWLEKYLAHTDTWTSFKRRPLAYRIIRSDQQAKNSEKI